MIKPPSLIKSHTEFFSEDPAFVQLADTATPEQVADFTAKYEAATETGDWSALRVEGAGEPTTFTMRPMPADAFGKLVDLQQSGKVGGNEALQYAFRICLQAVGNLGDAKVTFVEDEHFGRIASLSFLETAGISGALGVRLMREIGGRAAKRASNLSGK